MQSNNKIKVLIVDDSKSMRALIAKFLNNDQGFVVIGTAANGKEAYEKILASRPDVATMDIEMPVMNGIKATEKIMKDCPVPILIFSNLSKPQSRLTMKALSLGAIDFLLKPQPGELRETGKILLNKLRVISGVKVIKRRFVPVLDYSKRKTEDYSPRIKKNRLVVFGISTGGPASLETIFSDMHVNKKGNASFIIVQHMPPVFTEALAIRLNEISELEVKEAQDNDLLKPNHCYITPGDADLSITGAKTIKLTKIKQWTNNFVPSINTVMLSAAKIFKSSTIGVIMTGMGSDGLEGMRFIKKIGGQTIAQDEETSVVFGMPRACIEGNVIDKVVPLSEIPATIRFMLGK